MDAAPNKSVGIRTLVISVMMSMLISVVVFVVISMGYVFPQMSVQDLRMVSTQKHIEALNQRIIALEEAAAANAPAGAPVAEAAPAAPAEGAPTEAPKDAPKEAAK